MWQYRQSTGVLDHDGAIVAVGYSGHGAGKNNPAMEQAIATGPIPRGRYEIGAAFDHPAKGPLCMRLEPDEANEMHGRCGFMVHGDSIAHPGEASNGCIILPHQIREMIAQSEDRALSVVE